MSTHIPHHVLELLFIVASSSNASALLYDGSSISHIILLPRCSKAQTAMSCCRCTDQHRAHVVISHMLLRSSLKVAFLLTTACGADVTTLPAGSSLPYVASQCFQAQYMPAVGCFGHNQLFFTASLLCAAGLHSFSPEILLLLNRLCCMAGLWCDWGVFRWPPGN